MLKSVNDRLYNLLKILFYKYAKYMGQQDDKMIKECNFKSSIRHRHAPGCNLTPNDIVCPGEENCILFQIYIKTLKK